jgi:ADP-heptose:LPS heptosyltransferase
MSRPRVLVLRPGAMGDVCLSLPVVAGLARHADVTWLLRPAYVPLVRLFPSIKVHILPFEVHLGTRNSAGRAAGLVPAVWTAGMNPAARQLDRETALIRRLTERRFDAVLDLCHWPETARLVRQLRAVPCRAIAFDPDQDRRLGIRLATADLYGPFNVRVPVAGLPHQMEKWQELVGAGLGMKLEEWPVPPVPEASAGPLRVFLQPHASRPAKVWPGRCFVEAITWLARRRPVEVLLNSGNRQEWARTLSLAARLLWRGVRVRVIVKDRSYRRLTAALRRCHLALGNDSGPMHLASLLGVQTVVLFGPYAPEEFGPRWRSVAVSAGGKATSAVLLEDVLAALGPWSGPANLRAA